MTCPADEMVPCPVCDGSGSVPRVDAEQLPRLDAQVMIVLSPPDGMDLDDIEATAKAIGRALTGWNVSIGEGLTGHDD